MYWKLPAIVIYFNIYVLRNKGVFTNFFYLLIVYFLILYVH